MKFFLASLLVAAVSSFSPSRMANTRVSTTQAFNQLDPDILQHLAKHGEDAETAMFINCDEEGCELMEGVHESDGWSFETKGDANPSDHKSHMLMMSMEDTE